MATKRDNQRIFYYDRQVKAALALTELREMVEKVLEPTDKAVAAVFRDLAMCIFDAMPISPAAVGQAQREYKSMKAQRTERERQQIAALQDTLKGEVDRYQRAWLRGLIEEIENRDGRSVLLMLASIREAAETAEAKQSEDERIDQIAGELLQDFDF